MKKRLYDEYLRRLLEVNDESKTDDEHRLIEARFRGWLEGVEDAAGHRFNGDYYYIIELFNSGKMRLEAKRDILLQQLESVEKQLSELED